MSNPFHHFILNRRHFLGLAVALFLGLSVSQASALSADTPLPDIPEAYCVPVDAAVEQAEVIAVTASNRMAVELDGEVVIVRLLAIDTNSTTEAAAAHALLDTQALTGRSVTLVGDGMDTDEEGNLMRYVFSEDSFVNFSLIEQGYATVAHESFYASCYGFFLVAQAEAQQERLGTWIPADVRMDPAEWQQWPVVPLISENARKIYLNGLGLGNNPNAFTIYGDCQSLAWRLFAPLDRADYQLPEEYLYLEYTRYQFGGSFERNPITTADSATVASMYSVLWADRKQCQPGENPLACEWNVHNPSIAFISLGTNWKGTAREYEDYLRRLVQDSINLGILPIVVTKVDSSGMDYPLNRVMAQVAYDYDIPLWNFWAAVQDMPNRGMDPDDPRGIHFLPEAYTIKRLTGLMSLHAVLEAGE
ncbi:MAG: hypothetical protein HND51_23110 [Chloroflexi bacterium]|nr:hypothetical protein [Chloroflexota bacterium]